jgi:hypothetical protein
LLVDFTLAGIFGLSEYEAIYMKRRNRMKNPDQEQSTEANAKRM